MRSYAIVIAAGLTGCAQGVCDRCPTATLTANDSTELAAHVGDLIAYAWQSDHADVATSSVTVSSGSDRCGNSDGPWVVQTLVGTTPAVPLLDCQSGFVYTLTFTVAQSATGDTASASVTIRVD